MAATITGQTVVRVTDTMGSTADATVITNAFLALAPSTLTVAVNNTAQFIAIGGVPPYSFAMLSGTGAVTASGFFTAPPAAGSGAVRVTDSLGHTSDAMVVTNPAIALAPTQTTLTPGQSLTFTANGGVPPYSFTLQGTPPTPLPGGVYTAPIQVGTEVVRVTDIRGNFAEATVTVVAMTVSPQTKTLAVNNTLQLTANGGLAPYAFTLVQGAGAVSASGFYTAPAMPTVAKVRATDAMGEFAEGTITVNPALLIFPGPARSIFTNDLGLFSAFDGVPPYTFSLVSGNGTMTSFGGYTAPAAPGTDVVRVTDDYGNTSDCVVSIGYRLTVSPQGVSMMVNNSETYTVTGGFPPYFWWTQPGEGTVTQAGVYTAPNTASPFGGYDVHVTDSKGNEAWAEIFVQPQLQLLPAAKTLALGAPFTFSTVGGVGPFTLSIDSGGGTFASTGLFTAPVTAGTTVLRITDSRGNTGTASVSVVSLFAPAVNQGAFASPSPLSAVSGDWNFDGAADLAVTSSAGLTIALGLGGGSFQFGPPASWPPSPTDVRTADFNLDGKPDLLTVEYGAFGGVSFIAGTGTATFGNAVGSPVGGFPTQATVADFNADGKPDVAVSNQLAGTSTVSVLLGTGTGTFLAPVAYTVGLKARRITSGDWNLDGKPDLAVTNGDSDSVSVLLGTGTGTFGAATSYAVGINPRGVTRGDFNFDGKLDLAVANFGAHTLSVLIGNGNGTFQAQVVYPVQSWPDGIEAVDLNNDGKVDLATVNTQSMNPPVGNTVSVLHGFGNGTFGPTVNYATDAIPVQLVVGDWNNDGKKDLVTVNTSGNNISVLMNALP